MTCEVQNMFTKEPWIIPMKRGLLKEGDGQLLVDVSSYCFRLILKIRTNFLKNGRVPPWENDDSEYLPYHVLNKRREDIKKIFNDEIGLPEEISENIVNMVYPNYEEFLDIFFHRSLYTFRRLMYIHNANNLIFCRDDLRENIWRIDVHPSYKNNRGSITKHKGSKLSLGKLFSAIYQLVFPKLAKALNAKILKVHRAEADDIIAVATNHYVKFHQKVVIIGEDSDYLQLLKYPNVHIFDHSGFSLKNKLGKKSPEDFLVEKILRGDRTDNIPSCQILVDDLGNYRDRNISDIEADIMESLGILKRKPVSQKEAIFFLKNPSKIIELLKLDPVFRTTFLRNNNIINITDVERCIPAYIQTEILCQLNKP